MIKIWLGLGIAALLLALAIFLDQVLRAQHAWCWDGIWNHESLIGIAGSAGIALLVVTAVEYTRHRKGKS
jgi:hypothetical protein